MEGNLARSVSEDYYLRINTGTGAHVAEGASDGAMLRSLAFLGGARAAPRTVRRTLNLERITTFCIGLINNTGDLPAVIARCIYYILSTYI